RQAEDGGADGGDPAAPVPRAAVRAGLPMARYGPHQHRRGAHGGVDALLPAQGAALRLGAQLTYNGGFAGIAQLVERNLAKVEVASSRLVSRSRFLQKGAPQGVLPFC